MTGLEPLAVASFGALWYGAPVLARRLWVHRSVGRCASERCIALTYDDGPGPSTTRRVVEALEVAAVRATFFVLGRKVREMPHVVSMAAAAGHEIGCHGHEHLNAWKTWPWKAGSDLLRGVREIRRAGLDCRLYRPPYGKATLATLALAWRLGLRVCWWTHISGDTYEPRPPISDLVARVICSEGGVILMHDFDGDPERAEYTLEATRALIQEWRRVGGRFETLSGLLDL